MSESEDDERVAKLNFKKDRIHFGGLDEEKKDIRDDLPPGEEEGSDSSEVGSRVLLLLGFSPAPNMKNG